MGAWIAAAALPWLKAHWKDACVLASVVLAGLFLRASGQLAECRAALAKPALVVTQTQAASTTASAHGSARVVPGRPRPCPALGMCPPCPEVLVTFGASASASQAQTQTATIKASPEKQARGGAAIVISLETSLPRPHELGEAYGGVGLRTPFIGETDLTVGVMIPPSNGGLDTWRRSRVRVDLGF